MIAVLRRPLVMLGLVVLALVAALLIVPQTRWRLQVVLLHLSGGIDDISFGEVLRYMLPGSEQTMSFFLEQPNPYAVIRNPKSSAADLETGASLYQQHCASCHGVDGNGGPVSPSLVNRRFKNGESDWAVYRTVRDGVPNTAMMPTPMLEEDDRWRIIAFLRSLEGGAKPASVSAAIEVNVPYAELEATDRPGDDWLTYSGSYSSTRQSTLSEIDSGNVHRLGLRWAHQFDGQPPLEVSPLVKDGVMFVSVPPCSVTALDAETGKTIWTWSCDLLNRSASEISGPINRGVALLDDKVFIGTWDSRLVALSAATGAELWQTTVAEDHAVYYISGAPLVYGDLVVTGVATRDVGIGFVAAFDAETGRRRWSFQAIPGPGEFGNDTWAGDSWMRGGAPTWLTGSYDPEEDLLYWGVGNPKPDYDTSARAGDNLYSNSVVALRGSTGELVWYFQFTPADDKDWDSNQIPVLIDHAADDGVEKRLLWANRNGYYYVFERVSGKLLLGTPFVELNWSEGLDSAGRPILRPRSNRPEGEYLSPGNVGATSWWSPTYYAERNLFIVPVLEQGMVYFPSFNSPPRSSGRPFYTAVRALDAATGQVVWEHRRPERFADNRIAGVTSTAGGVVFGGDRTAFFALDAESGEILWEVETGGSIIAAPVTYTVRGRQFVTIAAGGDLFTFSLPAADESPRLSSE